MSNANAGQRKVIATALPLPPDVTPYFIVFVVYNDPDGEWRCHIINKVQSLGLTGTTDRSKMLYWKEMILFI